MISFVDSSASAEFSFRQSCSDMNYCTLSSLESLQRSAPLLRLSKWNCNSDTSHSLRFYAANYLGIYSEKHANMKSHRLCH